MANRGDAGVLEAIDRFAKSLARVIYNIQAIYDPEVFAVGGAISQQNLFIESLIRNVDSIYNRLHCIITLPQRIHLVAGLRQTDKEQLQIL